MAAGPSDFWYSIDGTATARGRATRVDHGGGDRHEYAAACPVTGDSGGNPPRLGAAVRPHSRARQSWRAKRRVHPGFLRHLASREPSLVHTAGVWSGAGQESIARKGDWRERLQLARRRLQKSHLAAVGRRRREEEGRALAGRRDLSKPVE